MFIQEEADLEDKTANNSNVVQRRSTTDDTPLKSSADGRSDKLKPDEDTVSKSSSLDRKSQKSTGSSPTASPGPQLRVSKTDVKDDDVKESKDDTKAESESDSASEEEKVEKDDTIEVAEENKRKSAEEIKRKSAEEIKRKSAAEIKRKSTEDVLTKSTDESKRKSAVEAKRKSAFEDKTKSAEGSPKAVDSGDEEKDKIVESERKPSVAETSEKESEEKEDKDDEKKGEFIQISIEKMFIFCCL